MSEITIRPYDEKYREDVQNICLDTAGTNAREPKVSKALLATFCDYYIERESGHCLVAVNGEDKAVGYILCAPDYGRYKRIFMSEYYPRIRGCGFVARVEAWGSAVAPTLFKRRYPAHLHINMSPGCGRMGCGRKLMGALLEHLNDIGVAGVMLIVGEANGGARKFYQKCGFNEIFVTKFGVVMARETREEESLC